MRKAITISVLLCASLAHAQWLSVVASKQESSGVVATPTFSPGAGTYSSTQTVTISSSTGSAVLCYTTDGTTPTETANLCLGGTTQTYSTPISVSTTQTVKALGTKTGLTDSSVASALYTINASFGCPSGSGSCFDTLTQGSTVSLPTYNSNWALVLNQFGEGDPVSYWTVTSTGAYIGTSGSFGYGFVAYTPSTSSTSQVTVGAMSVAGLTSVPCVRMTTGTTNGYCIYTTGPGTTQTVFFAKDNSTEGSAGCASINNTTTNTLKIVASGTTSPVTIRIYLNGTICSNTYTDSASPYTTGAPGITQIYNATPTLMTNWQDH